MELGGFGLKGLLDGILHVAVELLDELEERLHLVLEHRLEGAVEIDDDLECQDGIVLVVVAKDVEHGGHEAVGVGLEHFLLWETMCGLEDNVSEPLLGCLGGEGARRCVEERDKGGNDVFQEQGIVEVLKEVEKLLELESGCELCFGVCRGEQRRCQKGMF